MGIIQNKYSKMYALFLIKSVSLFVIVASAVALWDYLEPTSETLSVLMDMYISSYGVWGMVFFMFLCAVLSMFFVPRQVLSFVGGYAYGIWLGTLIATIGVTLGCFLSFVYSRFMVQKLVQQKFGLRIAWLEHLFSKNPFGMALSIRVIPVGSNVLLNMVAGVTKIPLVPFCLGSGLGYIPQNLVSALLGSGMREDPLLRVSLAAILYAFGIVVGLLLFRRYRPDEHSSLKSIVRGILKPRSMEYNKTTAQTINQ